MKYQNLILILLLLLPGVYLRLADMQHMEFKGDESNILLITHYNVHGPDWVPIGLMSSTGLYNPPGFSYLLSLPGLFTSDPVAMTYFIALLNIAAVVLLYFFVRYLFDRRMAMFSSILFASLPWAIMFSRKIWAQNTLAIFVIAFYFLLFSNLKKYSSFKVLGLFVCFSLISQIHMSAWFMLLPLAVFFMIFKIKIKWRDALIGVALLLGSYAIYFHYHHITNYENITFFMDTREHSTQSHTSEHVTQFFGIHTGLNFDYLMGDGVVSAFAGHSFVATVWNGVFALFILLAVVALIAETIEIFQLFNVKNRTDMTFEEQFRVLSLLILVSVQLAYFVLKVPPHPHYSIVLYPLLVIIITHFLCRTLTNTTPYLPYVLLLFVAVNYHFTYSMIQGVKKHPEMITGDYGVPYVHSKWQEKIEQITPKLENKTFSEFMAGFKMKPRRNTQP